MRRLILAVSMVSALSSLAVADQVLEVTLDNPDDVGVLLEVDAQPVMQTPNGFVVLIDDDVDPARLREAGLALDILATGVSPHRLALRRAIGADIGVGATVLYQQDDLCLLLMPDSDLTGESWRGAFPPRTDQLRIRFRSSRPQGELAASVVVDLDSLLGLIRQDSLESYVHRLEAFTHRLAGTDSNYAARDWIEARFRSFGYDSVSLDPFTGRQLFDRIPVPCYNVVAFKEGVANPDRQIVIGAHFDAVPYCPGADDNASGTAAVLELARVLREYPTRMSITFIAFDSEESWMWGSYHYVEEAVARGDDITLMINPDMIGHITNHDRARLYYGYEDAYARLWRDLADSLVGIEALLSGQTASDHLPFQEADYPVIFVQEYNFSTHYHLPSDVSAFLNFDYMTRMVKGILATVLVTDVAPPSVYLAGVWEPGDGQSLQIHWRPLDPAMIAGYRAYCYPPVDPSAVATVEVSATDTFVTFTGLQPAVEYCLYVHSFDADGNLSIVREELFATPYVEPRPPAEQLALPLKEAIRVTWRKNNLELDFDHYQVIRDGFAVGTTIDTVFVDDDPGLGVDFHRYLVRAVDVDGYASDTIDLPGSISRAATLDPQRVLALNRSSIRGGVWVDEVETGVFMREAVAGYDCDYFSDTAGTLEPGNTSMGLMEMIDYGTLVVGMETGRSDDIGCQPATGGILDTLSYFMSIGGGVVVFGRWGDIPAYDTTTFLDNVADYDDAYHNYFHMSRRVNTPTDLVVPGNFISDYVGSHSMVGVYPDLVWDSVLTAQHCAPYAAHLGIPFGSFVELWSPEPEVIYTYDARFDDSVEENQPVGWRYLGTDYRYVFFNIPLSFMERTAAIGALRQALADVAPSLVNVDDGPARRLPTHFALRQNYPNPFNPSTTIEYVLPGAAKVRLVIYNLLGRRVTTLVDGRQPSGRHRVVWDGNNASGEPVASGVYLYRLTADDFTASKKMILLK